MSLLHEYTTEKKGCHKFTRLKKNIINHANSLLGYKKCPVKSYRFSSAKTDHPLSNMLICQHMLIFEVEADGHLSHSHSDSFSCDFNKDKTSENKKKKKKT